MSRELTTYTVVVLRQYTTTTPTRARRLAMNELALEQNISTADGDLVLEANAALVDRLLALAYPASLKLVNGRKPKQEKR